MKNFTQLSTHQLNDKIKEGVEAAMEGKLPEIVREAGEKEFLNSRQVKEVFNIPYRSQKHLRDTFQVPYTQYGKAIIYLRSEIVAWITTNKVRYKRIIERQDLDSNTIKTSKKAKQFNGQNWNGSPQFSQIAVHSQYKFKFFKKNSKSNENTRNNPEEG